MEVISEYFLLLAVKLLELVVDKVGRARKQSACAFLSVAHTTSSMPMPRKVLMKSNICCSFIDTSKCLLSKRSSLSTPAMGSFCSSSLRNAILCSISAPAYEKAYVGECWGWRLKVWGGRGAQLHACWWNIFLRFPSSPSTTASTPNYHGCVSGEELLDMRFVKAHLREVLPPSQAQLHH